MGNWPVLSVVTFLPLVGVLFLALVRGDDDVAKRNIRVIALLTTVVDFLLSLLIWAGFDPSNPGFQLVGALHVIDADGQ